MCIMVHMCSFLNSYVERKDDKQDRVKEVGHTTYLSDTPLVRILCWVVLYREFEKL